MGQKVGKLYSFGIKVVDLYSLRHVKVESQLLGTHVKNLY